MLYRVCLLLLVPVLSSCGAGDRDPVAEAQFQNEKRIGDADVTRRQERDAEFMVNAAGTGLLTLELSKLAQQKAAAAPLRTFALELQRSHTGLHAALRTLAQQKSLTLPDGLGREQQRAYQDLVGLTGARFDEQFLQLVATGHDEAADDFQDMAEDAYDGDIRAFAAKYAPILEQHHNQAEQLRDQLPR
ncbi:DUF4142 domain-containing protein [Hymenobacter sp. B81]|uniref:DUF4142 domain-containing protein n=1 Tax=Hymenobacter sp. B81 TaxID=3344878 RepID=UPI0037DCA4B2